MGTTIPGSPSRKHASESDDESLDHVILRLRRNAASEITPSTNITTQAVLQVNKSIPSSTDVGMKGKPEAQSAAGSKTKNAIKSANESKKMSLTTAGSGLLKNWDKSVPTKPRQAKGGLYTKLSQQHQAIVKGRLERPAFPETHMLIDPTSGKIIQGNQSKFPAKGVLSRKANSEADRPRKLSPIQHVYLPEGGFIPLICPYYQDDKLCPREGKCIFLHTCRIPLKKLPISDFASYRLFEQAEMEARQKGPYEFKFGFNGNARSCTRWRHGDCSGTAETCWWAHWKPKIPEPCRFQQQGDSRTTPQQCVYKHIKDIPSQIPLSTQVKQRAQRMLSVTESSESMAIEDDKESNENDLSRQTSEAESDEETLFVTGKSTKRISAEKQICEIKLMYSDKVIEAQIQVSSRVASKLSQAHQQMNLENVVLFEHAEEFLNIGGHRAFCHGKVESKTCCEELQHVGIRLWNQSTGAVVILPQLDIIFIPERGSENWQFLQPTPNQISKDPGLLFYIYKKGTDLSKLQTPLKSEQDFDFNKTSHLDWLEVNLPNADLFHHLAQSADEKGVLIIGYNDLKNYADVKVFHHYFQEIGVNIFTESNLFLQRTNSGVVVVHPSLELFSIRNIDRFDLLLQRDYAVYQMGTIPETGKFCCQPHLQTGYLIYLTMDFCLGFPDVAKIFVNHVCERYASLDYARQLKMVVSEHTLKRIQEPTTYDMDFTKLHENMDLKAAFDDCERLGRLLILPEMNEDGAETEDEILSYFSIWVLSPTHESRRMMVVHSEQESTKVPKWRDGKQHIQFCTALEFKQLFGL